MSVFLYTYFFLSSWDTPSPDIVAVDPNAINRWITRTNLRINIYWAEFNYWLKIFRLYLNLKNKNSKIVINNGRNSRRTKNRFI
jgi:hypothetical protein